MFKIFVMLCVAMMVTDAVPLSPTKNRVYPQLIALPSRLALPQAQPGALPLYPPIPQVVINRQMEIIYKSFVDTMSLEHLIVKIAEHLDLDSVYEAIGNVTLKELYSAFKPAIETISSVWNHIEHFWEILCKKPAPPQPPKEPACEDCDHPHESNEHVEEHHEEESYEHVEEHHHVVDKDHKKHEADSVHEFTGVQFTESAAHADKLVVTGNSKTNGENTGYPVTAEAAIGRSWYKPDAAFPWKLA